MNSAFTETGMNNSNQQKMPICVWLFCCSGHLNSVGGVVLKMWPSSESKTSHRAEVAAVGLQLNNQINVFKSTHCSFEFCCAHGKDQTISSPPLCFCRKEGGQSSDVNWGKERKNESSQDLPERFSVKKRAAILWTCGGEKNKISAVGGDLPGPSICQRSVRFVDWNF